MYVSHFNIYDFDKDSSSMFIHYNGWAEGYEAKNGLNLLLFNMVADSNLDLYPSGIINIYDMCNGKLKKTVQLPPDGKVMCFENYPNDIWYAKNIKEPEREIYKISFDSSSDEPKVKKLFPK